MYQCTNVGIGGFRLALESLPGNHRCVFACETNTDARQCYKANFGHEPQGKDVFDVHALPPHDILTCGFPCRSFSRAGHRTCDLQLIRHVLTALAPQTRRLVLLENVMTFPSIADGAALRSVLGWLHDAGFPHVHHRVLSIAPLTGLAQARRRWLCVATRTPTPTFAWPTPLPLSRRRVLADVLLPTPKLLHCPHIHALADRPPLTRRTPRLYQRAYRRRNTQHSRIYDEFGLAPTVSTTSAVYVWHDGTQARLLQARELARLQGLPDNFVLPEGRVVATRLIGNAVPPALIRALLL